MTPAPQRPEDVVTRVLIVDDHRTFTDLVCLALAPEPDLACVGTAHSAAEARVQVSRHTPDLVLMDVDLGDGDGLDLTEELLRLDPALRVVVLTAYGHPRVLQRAAAVGACALLPKDGSLRELLHSLRHARQGELFVHAGLLRSMVVDADHGARPWLPGLTPRESLVLELLTDGRQVNDIARELGITVHTCRGYVKTLLAKLGAHSQLEAVVIAGRHGLVGAQHRR